jgi:phosphatidylserine/phosphatidylglycerophosphate/cardiolipin synthase-like enzyme
MKRFDYAAAAALLLCQAVAATSTAAEIELYFSPNGGAAAAVVKEIDAAKTSVHVLAYSISEDRITRALTRAKTRGVAVILVVDPGQQRATYSTAPKIKHAGVTTLVDRAHALMHNKTIIIDTAVVVTGSMNLTASGDKQNAENTIILRNAAAAAIYEDDFQKHLKHSTAFQPPPALPFPKPTPTQKEPFTWQSSLDL